MHTFFELPAQAKARFPSHGWIKGCNGARQLRLPILRIFQMNHPVHERYTAHNLGGVWLQIRSPFRTLRQLGIALRELHVEVRKLLTISEMEWWEQPVSRERDLALNDQGEGFEHCEVLLIAAFILLRRLADDLTDSLRPVLFKHWQSAPSQLKNAILMAQAGRVQSLSPNYDDNALTKILVDETNWLSMLRKDGGIRDILVHRPHILQVNHLGTKPLDAEGFTWHVTANLTTLSRDGVKTVELFHELTSCLIGACTFMTSLSRLIGGMNDFDRGDMLLLTGSDNDVVGFWPAIEGGQYDFPLRD